MAVDYGNIHVPARLTATLSGPVVFADGSHALTRTIASANGNYVFHLRPASGVTPGTTFTLEVTLTSLSLTERVSTVIWGTIAWELHLPLIRRDAP